MWLNFKDDDVSYEEVCYYIAALYEMFQEKIYLNMFNLKSLDKIETFIKKYKIPVLLGGFNYLENIALEINFQLQNELYMWNNREHTIWLFENNQPVDILRNTIIVERNKRFKNKCYLSLAGEDDNNLFVRVKKMKKN